MLGLPSYLQVGPEQPQCLWWLKCCNVAQGS